MIVVNSSCCMRSTRAPIHVSPPQKSRFFHKKATTNYRHGNAGALWMYLGSDPVEASEATDGMCTGNLFENNRVETASLGVKLVDTRDTMMISNTFIDADKNEWVNSDGLLWKVNDRPNSIVLVQVDGCASCARDALSLLSIYACRDFSYCTSHTVRARAC